MDSQNKIFTIRESAEGKFKEKGSVFISKAFPVSHEINTSTISEKIKKTYYDANHICFAQKFHNFDFKYSDDGEPSGSAGIRILNAIQQFNLTNIIIFVIRYFGGTKLGVGPLGKAYYTATADCLNNSEIIEIGLFINVKLNYEYDQTSNIHHLLSLYIVKNIQHSYEKIPEISFSLEFEKKDAFSAALRELTQGKSIIHFEENPVLLNK